MKLTIERADLMRALAHVQSVVERRNTIPILANVLLEADGDQLRLTATDLDLAIVESVAADIGKTGAITTPAHTLYDVVRKLPDGAQVALVDEGGEGRLSLSSGRSRFSLASLPREDFPSIAEDDLPHRFDIAAGDLKRLMEKTRFAISTEETRFYLNGIYLHVVDDGGDMLRAVATDGHRLAQASLPAPDGAAGMPGVIIPRKAVTELHKLLDEYDGAVSVALSDARIRFAFADAILTTKVIDGTFPDYERVIPSGNDKVMEVDAKQLSSAIDRVATISSEKSRAVKLALSKDQLILAVNSPETGSATEELPVSFDAGELEIGFNARYLMDILGQVEGSNVEVLLADSAAPTIVRDSSDERALYVIMPMRV